MSNASTLNASPAARRSGASLHRWIRQLHLWVGAWGALAAVLYGSTGLIMSHRFGDNAWPQGESEPRGKTTLAIPDSARGSAEALSLWLSETQGLEAHMIRKSKPEDGGRREGAREQQREAPKWSLNGGTARESWSLEYVPGAATADLKRTGHTPLAALTRLHKAVAGGPGWRVLGDSFAIGMILLGLSGLWLWARGRTPKQMLLSVLTVSVLAMAVVLIPNLL
jgi:hypothetical protein